MGAALDACLEDSAQQQLTLSNPVLVNLQKVLCSQQWDVALRLRRGH